MIVIAFNNNIYNLAKLLDSFIKVDLLGQTILIIDTGSTNLSAIIFLQQIKSIYNTLSIIVDKTPYSGYSTGAYIYAIKNYMTHEKYDDYFCFMHDSMEILDPSYFKYISSNLEKDKVVILYTFDPNIYESPSQENYILQRLGSTDYDYGVFGPILSIGTNNIQKINIEKIPIPTCKVEDCAMERGWGVIFKSLNIAINVMEGEYFANETPQGLFGKYTNKYFYHKIRQ